MSNFTKIQRKYQPAKWMLGMLMLFSIFSFTGFSGAIKQDLRQAVKTEVSIVRELKVVKRTISYKRGYGLFSQHALPTDFGQNFASLLRMHTQLIKVKFGQLSLKQHQISRHVYFFRLSIPENSDDDISIAG